MPVFCPQCRTELRDGKTFCGKCGTSLPPETGALMKPAGRSRIELDSQLINSLLAMFVNKPGQTQVELKDGSLRVQQGTLNVTLDPIQLNEAIKLQLTNGSMGPFRIQIDQLQLGQNGLEIELKLQ